jgi:hypothetical protein
MAAGDITNPRVLYAKGMLFLTTGVLAALLLIQERPTLKVIALLALCVWCFARAYYFAFLRDRALHRSGVSVRGALRFRALRPALAAAAMSDALDPIFVLSNRVEACLWLGIAASLAVATRRAGSRRDCVAAAIAFALFGVSDVVEATTGAWWRPWWLLIWKGGCVIAFLWLLARHVRRRRRLKIGPDL